MILQFKKILTKYHISLFQASLFSFFFMPVAIFSILYYILLLFFATTALNEIALFLILTFSVLLFVFYGIMYFFQCRSLRSFGRDFRRNSFSEVECYLTYSEPMIGNRFFNMPNRILGFQYWSQRASFHKCYFKLKQDNICDKYFYYIQSKDRLEIFQKLFHSMAIYDNKVGFWPKRVDFKQHIPVKLVYGTKSHVVKEFLPVEDYPYSEEQFALFQKLNGKGRWRKGKILKNAVCFEKKYCNSLISLGILCVYSIVWSIAVWDIIFYLLCWTTNGADIVTSFVDLVLAPLGLVIVGALLAFMYQVAANQGECVDIISSWKRKKECSDEVVLLSGDSFRVANNFSTCFGYLFPKEAPLLQKLYFRRLNSDETKSSSSDCYVNWIYTTGKVEVLNLLYKCRDVKRYSPTSYERPISTEPTHGENPYSSWTLRTDEAAVRSGLLFESGVPLKIIYFKPGLELKSIAPVEGYSYTPEQLAAIEKFNTLYP